MDTNIYPLTMACNVLLRMFINGKGVISNDNIIIISINALLKKGKAMHE